MTEREELNELLRQMEAMLPTGEFNAGLDTQIEFVEAVIKDSKKKEDWGSCMILKTAEGPTIYCILANFSECDNHEERAAYMEHLGAQVGNKGGVYVAGAYLITGAYMKAMTNAENDKRDKNLRLQEDPTSTEIINIAGLTLDKRSNMAYTTVQRTPKGKYISGLGEWTKDYYEKNPGEDKGAARMYLLEHFFRSYLIASGAKVMGRMAKGRKAKI